MYRHERNTTARCILGLIFILRDAALIEETQITIKELRRVDFQALRGEDIDVVQKFVARRQFGELRDVPYGTRIHDAGKLRLHY